MQAATICRILGLLLILLSLSFIPPLFIEAWYQDGYALIFAVSFAFTLGIGFLLWFLFRNNQQPLRTHEGFLIVVLFWLLASLVGTFPMWIAIEPSLSFTDALFESVSGITTTGATVMTNLDSLSHSFLYYRQQLQFLGGLGIVVLAVAILPALGIGGMQLFRAEVSAVKDDKFTPKIAHVAKSMWFIYVTFTIACAISFYLSGMSWFDAVCHSFSTVATGGFSTHDDSLSYFNSNGIKLVSITFMLLGAISFSLHVTALKNGGLKYYFLDPELRFYLQLLFLSILIMFTLFAFSSNHLLSPTVALDTLFQTVSFATTSGFSSANVTWWPNPIPMLLLFLGVIGGCAGSTTGGIKVVRIHLLQKQGAREIQKLIHPHGQYLIKLGQLPLSGRVIESIWGFLGMYIVSFAILLLILLICEKDFLTAFSALCATFSNAGRGLGQVATNFSSLSSQAKWVLTAAMLIGRLEIFTVIVLFSPSFWRR